MNRTLLFGIAIFLVLVGISLLGGDGQAIAGHGCHGCGGATSCYGRSAYRNCHGCWGRSYLYHSPVISRRCHGCGGCSGGIQCHGEDTIIESQIPAIPLIETPAAPEQPTPAASDSDEDGTTKINLNVPSDATVFVNGRSTKSTGSQRSYVSNGLLHGHEYMFAFRVEVNRHGQTMTRHKTITVSANEVHDVSFDFDATHVAVVSDR